jgi:hypothetical protein
MFRKIKKKVIQEGPNTHVGFIYDTLVYKCDSCEFVSHCNTLGLKNCPKYSQVPRRGASEVEIWRNKM